MYGEFLEFFDRIISINQFFFCKELSEVAMHILHYFMCSRCISQFLDEYSNLRQNVRRMLFMMHLMPFTCHILITAAAIFLCNFSPSSGNGRHCPLSTSGTSGTLCARPA